MVYPALLSLMRTIRLPVGDSTDARAVLKGLVCFAERQNRVSARVPSHFKRSLPKTTPTPPVHYAQSRELQLETSVYKLRNS